MLQLASEHPVVSFAFLSRRNSFTSRWKVLASEETATQQKEGSMRRSWGDYTSTSQSSEGYRSVSRLWWHPPRYGPVYALITFAL